MSRLQQSVTDDAAHTHSSGHGLHTVWDEDDRRAASSLGPEGDTLMVTLAAGALSRRGGASGEAAELAG